MPSIEEIEEKMLGYRAEALQLARVHTRTTGRKHVVRHTGGGGNPYLVVPLYMHGKEGQVADPGYGALGVLVEESFR